MTPCRICSEHLNNPVCLPCGHVFCSRCIKSTIQAYEPYIPHQCPTCDTCFNIAPIDMKLVPKNLRPFITPSIRELLIEAVPSKSRDAPEDKSISSDPFSRANRSAFGEAGSRSQASLEQISVKGKTSEMARLRAENQVLRNQCALWRKRAQMHGEANLTLLNLARVLRDQASQIARDRNDLEKRCFHLKQMIDGDCSYSDEILRFEPRSDLPMDDLRNKSQSAEDLKSRIAASADEPRKRQRVSPDGDR